MRQEPGWYSVTSGNRGVKEDQSIWQKWRKGQVEFKVPDSKIGTRTVTEPREKNKRKDVWGPEHSETNEQMWVLRFPTTSFVVLVSLVTKTSPQEKGSVERKSRGVTEGVLEEECDQVKFLFLWIQVKLQYYLSFRIDEGPLSNSILLREL